jgi:hypothetical protein
MLTTFQLHSKADSGSPSRGTRRIDMLDSVLIDLSMRLKHASMTTQKIQEWGKGGIQGNRIPSHSTTAITPNGLFLRVV